MDTLRRFEALPSTNAYALSHFDEFSDGGGVLADRQTNGYGRNGKPWASSVNGNLYLTLVMKPNHASCSATCYTTVTHYVAVALVKTFRDYGVESTIKWPNDVKVDGAKIAGILCEGVVVKEEFKGAVLGVGVNLAMTKDDLALVSQPATSLNLLIERPVDRDEFLSRLLGYIFGDMARFRAEGFAMIRNAYVDAASFLGKHVAITTAIDRIEGFARSVDASGRLHVESDGREHIIDAGELEILD